MWQHVALGLVLGVAGASARLIDPSEYTDCSGNYGTSYSVEIDPCPSTDTVVCDFQIGQTYTAHVNFTATTTTPTARNAIYGIIFGIKIPWVSGYEANECGNGLTCPVIGGVNTNYVASLQVPAVAPMMTLLGEWSVKDVNDNAFICFQFDIRVS